MAHKLLNGTRRLLMRSVLAVLALLSLAVGCYTAQQGFAQALDAQSGNLTFTIPSFHPMDSGSLDPNVVSLSIEALRLQVASPDSVAQSLFTASTLLTSATVLFTLATVVLLCYRLIRSTPFGGRFVWLVAISGLIAVAAGLLGPVLEGMAKQRVVAQLSGAGSLDSPVAIGDLAYYATSSFDPIPVCIGLVSLLLIAVFRAGNAMERDAKGLV